MIHKAKALLLKPIRARTGLIQAIAKKDSNQGEAKEKKRSRSDPLSWACVRAQSRQEVGSMLRRMRSRASIKFNGSGNRAAAKKL